MLDTNERQEVKFFTGYEVEHTVCHGMKTLFVVGIQSTTHIVAQANTHQCNHIYFGTSQSFNLDRGIWEDWDTMISQCLELDYWVSLDFDVEYCDVIRNASWCQYRRFVPMISVKIPNINQFNYNTTLKIDDSTWGKSNPGVWTHHLTSLMSKETYTHWDQYTQDTEIK